MEKEQHTHKRQKIAPTSKSDDETLITKDNENNTVNKDKVSKTEGETVISMGNFGLIESYNIQKIPELTNKIEEMRSILLPEGWQATPNRAAQDSFEMFLWPDLISSLQRFEEKVQDTALFCQFLLKTKSSIVLSPANGYFCVLPTELIFQIFIQLELKDLASCLRVSKEWYRIGTDDQLYRSICIKESFDLKKPDTKTWRWVVKCHTIVFRDVVKNGCGTYLWSDNKGLYIGEWEKDLKHGYGSQKWLDGSQYRGEWFQDNKHGFGMMTWADGQSYTGEWRNNRKEGKGVELWADGRKYVGEYKNSNMHGFGTYTWPGGDCYVGEWRDDNMDGVGTYTWPNGSQYQGSWEHDEHNGAGKYICGGESYEGEWKNNGRHGRGKEIWSSGVVYEGCWKDNRKNGQGIFQWPDNDYYKGEWRDGKRYGLGVLISKGKVFYQEWKEGEQIEELEKGLDRAIEIGVISEFGEEEEIDIEKVIKRKREMEEGGEPSTTVEGGEGDRERKKMKIAEPFSHK